MKKISYVQFIYYYTLIHALHFQFVCLFLQIMLGMKGLLSFLRFRTLYVYIIFVLIISIYILILVCVLHT